MNGKSEKTKIFTNFHDVPARKTSAEIINEARLAIKESQMTDKSFVPTSIKPLQTQRPYTPRDKERLLFGKKIKNNRPPSSFSLRYLQNETETPVQDANALSNLKSPIQTISLHNKHQRSNSLSEISDDRIFNIPLKEPHHKVRLPSLDNLKLLQKRKIYKTATSLDNLPEEKEFESRNAFSSPQERTDFTNEFGKRSTNKKSTNGNLTECLLLGPQNLEKYFDNRQIIENSQTLFLRTGYFNEELRTINYEHSISVGDGMKRRDIIDVINDLNAESLNKDNDRRVIELLNELYEKIDETNKIDPKSKIQILKTLYKYVESQNDTLLLNIARVILALKVTGNNLSGVCKLIFKIAKNDKNDQLFFQKNVLELFVDALGRSSPLDDAEACVYGYGAVKFLTMNSQLLEKILSLGILQLMVLHIKIINNAKTDKNQMSDQTNHALFQLTAALRNLVSDDEIYDIFISCGAVIELCHSMALFVNDLDIVSNISRTLSTISTNDCCCDALIEYQNIYRLFIRLFEKYPGNEEIIVRLTYTLGNIVAKIDNTRIKFYQEDNSIVSLMNLWKIYLERTLKNYSFKIDGENNDNDNNNNTNSEDVMIKIIRVIANTVINPEIGKAMNETHGTVLVDEILKVLISNPFKKNEELVMSILSTLNNLSYYYSAEMEHDVFHVKQIDIVEGITEYTRSKNQECVIESMRILGNLSRSKITRHYITETGLFKVIILLLDRDDLGLLKAVVGVFINLMSDNRSRLLFKQEMGIPKLIRILELDCDKDWLLGALICQVLWNYCIDTPDLYELFTEKEIQQLLVILADNLDEEKLFGITDGNAENETYATREYLIWEEFANVATNLLEKIEYFLDTFDQIQLEAEKDEPKTKDSSTNLSFAAW